MFILEKIQAKKMAKIAEKEKEKVEFLIKYKK